MLKLCNNYRYVYCFYLFFSYITLQSNLHTVIFLLVFFKNVVFFSYAFVSFVCKGNQYSVTFSNKLKLLKEFRFEQNFCRTSGEAKKKIYIKEQHTQSN